MIRQVLSRVPFILAVAFSVAWLALVGSYAQRLGWSGLAALEPADLAIFLAGAAGPLAGLWLFVAVFEQRRAVNLLIARLAEVIALSRHSLQQAESQTRTLVQLQAQAGLGASLEARRLAFHDLAANAAILAERLGVTSRESAAAVWSRYGAGDVTAFVQAFLTFATSHPDIAERMAEAVSRDTLARAALAAFVRRYERLLGALADDKIAREIVEEGALGRAFHLFKAADNGASKLMTGSDADDMITLRSREVPDTDLFEDDAAVMAERRPEPVRPEA